MQRSDELQPLVFALALGKQLLKLVNDQQYALLACPVRQPIAVRGIWMSKGGLPGGQGEPCRASGKFPPHCGGVRARRRRHPHRQLVQRLASRREYQAGPRRGFRGSPKTCSPQPGQHTRAHKRGFAGPDTPDTTSSPVPSRRRDIASSTSAEADSRPKNSAASRSPNELSPRYGEVIVPDMLTRGGAATPSVHVPL